MSGAPRSESIAHVETVSVVSLSYARRLVIERDLERGGIVVGRESLAADGVTWERRGHMVVYRRALPAFVAAVEEALRREECSP